jgi:thiol-disulfide isomerase/thioredoxin
MSPLATLLALAAVASSGDAVLVQFSSDSCAPCQAMQPAVSRLVSDGYPVQRIDVDRHPDTARQFKVRGVPTFVLLVGNQEAGRIEGPTSYDRLTELFAAAGKGGTAAPTQALQPTDFRSAPPEQAALAASVRLKVEDQAGYGFGTGTIIDTHDNEALVVTCGHLFRESQGKGRILIDLFAPGGPRAVEGQLIAYDLDRDIALVSMRPGIAVTPAAVAPPGFAVRQRDRVFTLGCDKGADATVRQSEITSVNKYQGKPNFTAAGAPIDGRSGGGLFTADGLLIGICNAADPRDDEGLYAGLASIHWQLDQIGQSEIYQRSTGLAKTATTPPAAGQGHLAVAPLAASLPDLPAEMPNRGLNVTPASFSSPPTAATASTLDDDSELVVIIRSKSNPSQRSEIYVVDQASPELLTGIIHAARRGSSDQESAVAARQPAPAARPVIRAQFSE